MKMTTSNAGMVPAPYQPPPPLRAGSSHSVNPAPRPALERGIGTQIRSPDNSLEPLPHIALLKRHSAA